MGELHRYWYGFTGNFGCRVPFGVGVTAYSRADAQQLICAFLDWEDLPTPSEVIEDVDVSTLDARTVLPHMSAPIWRGLWYPAANLSADVVEILAPTSTARQTSD